MTKLKAFIASIKKDAKTVAGDIATVGATVGGILLVVEQFAPAVHIPAPATTIIVSVSAIISTVVTQARRFTGAQKAASKS